MWVNCSECWKENKREQHFGWFNLNHNNQINIIRISTPRHKSHKFHFSHDWRSDKVFWMDFATYLTKLREIICDFIRCPAIIHSLCREAFQRYFFFNLRNVQIVRFDEELEKLIQINETIFCWRLLQQFHWNYCIKQQTLIYYIVLYPNLFISRWNPMIRCCLLFHNIN